MAETNTSDEISRFLDSGIYRFPNSNAVFMDPVRLLNRSYNRFRVSPSAYYSRFFQAEHHVRESPVASDSRKRKRKAIKPPPLNERERAADHRHQEAKPWLLEAHDSLLEASDLLPILSELRISSSSSAECSGDSSSDVEHSFIELGTNWRAPFYEITINFNPSGDEGSSGLVKNQNSEQRMLPIFNNLVVNETCDDVEAEFQNRHYVMPAQSSFYMRSLVVAST